MANKIVDDCGDTSPYNGGLTFDDVVKIIKIEIYANCTWDEDKVVLDKIDVDSLSYDLARFMAQFINGKLDE